MHMTEPDLVPFKAAVRNLSTRLRDEATATEHWASIAKNRGLPVVAVRLEDVAAALKTAYVNSETALSRLSEVQDMISSSEDMLSG